MRDRGEDLRQLEHVLPLAFAFLLPYVDYGLILLLSLFSFFYAAFISPRWIRVTTRASEREAGFSPGKLYYAFGIMMLLLLFREHLHVAAAVWAVLAVGDSVSNLAGRRWPWAPLPYNREKSLGGSIGFFMGAAVGSWTLLVWNLPQSDGSSSLKLAACCLCGSLVCTLAESLPNLVDDNLVIVVAGAGIFPLLLGAPDLIPELAGPWSHAVGINFLLAGLSVMVGWISWRGAASGDMPSSSLIPDSIASSVDASWRLAFPISVLDTPCSCPVVFTSMASTTTSPSSRRSATRSHRSVASLSRNHSRASFVSTDTTSASGWWSR